MAEKDTIFRTSVTMQESLSKALARVHEQEDPRGEDGNKIPYGQWLGEKAMARIEDEKSGRGMAQAPRFDMRAIELAALDGAEQGALRGLNEFAISLGKIFGARLDQQDRDLKALRSLLDYVAGRIDGDHE